MKTIRYVTPALLLTAALVAYAGTDAVTTPAHPPDSLPNLGTAAAESMQARIAAQLAAIRRQWSAGREQVDARGYPGISFAYCLPDGRCDSVAVGFSDLQHRIPMRGDERMLAGSIGKTFVAAVIMQLAEEGRLRLDEPISTFFAHEPWFARLANGPDITVRMLLAHRTGIGGTGNILRAAGIDAHARPDRIWSHTDRLPLDLPAKFPAGTQFEYRDENYDLAALVVEKVTNDSYYTEVSRRLLLPLQLLGTYPQNNSSERHLPGIANGYQRRDDSIGLNRDISTNGLFAVSPSYEWGGGGLVSNSPDLARWARSLFGGRVLRDATLAEMLAPLSSFDPKEQYGLGASIYRTPWGTGYGHTGYMTGYRSAMLYLPRYDLSVALQTNTDYLVSAGVAHHLEEESLLEALESIIPIIVARYLQW